MLSPLFVARRRPRLAWALPWALGAALLLGPTTLTVAQPRAALPNLGGGVSLTLGDERRLGQQIMPSLHNSGLVVEDPLLNQYLTDLWRPVFATARARGDVPDDMLQQFAWQLWLLSPKAINAFALPGGYFGFHLGLLASATDDAALASVLAHELSHVTQRHIARIIQAQESQAPWLIGAMILGAATIAASPDAGAALIVGGQAASIQNQLNFSRDMEQEADRQGLVVLSEAGFDPKGFVRLFETLQNANRLNDDGAFPYLRSHPLTTERVADMQGRLFSVPAEPNPVGDGAVKMPDPDASALLRVRAATIASADEVDVLQGWSAAPAATGSVGGATRPAEQWASDYQRALAAWAMTRPDVAWTRLRQLMMQTADQPAVSQVLRETALGWLSSPAKFETIPAATVQAWVEAALADAQAGRRSALLLLAGFAASTNSTMPDARRAQVVGALRTWLATHPNDALGWQLLARLSAQQGQALVALRAEAEAFVARELWQGALDRLSAAKRLIADAETRFSEADIAIIYAREKAVNQAMAFARSERR
jgi:predicted Zn-dependent protease